MKITEMGEDMKITVMKNELTSLSKDMKKDADQLSLIILNFKETAHSLGSIWSGASETEFQRRLESDYVPVLEDFVKNLEEHSEFLDQAVKSYQKLEDKYSGSIL